MTKETETPRPNLSLEAATAIAAQSTTEVVASSEIVDPPTATTTDWKAQFVKLDEKWINDSSGKQSGTYLCVCRHCNGQKIPFTGRYCRNHLKVCSKYLSSSPYVTAVPPPKRKAAEKLYGKAMKRISNGLLKGQAKFIETLACVGHDHEQVLVDLCQTLRCDFVAPPDIPQATRLVFQEAQSNLSYQLQRRVSEGYNLGCRILPGETIYTLIQAGDSATIELLSTLDTDGINVARSIEEFLQGKSFRFVTLPESRARRILAARHPGILWIPCMSRCLTLLVREMLSRFGTKLSLLSMNGRCDVPSRPLYAKDWSSLQGWLASMVKVRRNANLADKDWEEISRIERILRPFCWAKQYLEGHPSLSNAMLVFLSIDRYLLSTEDDLSSHVSRCLDDLWLNIEQPLYFLAFALNPQYTKLAKRILDDSLEQRGPWRTKRNPLTMFRLIQATGFYHTKFKLSGSAATLMADLQLWLNSDLRKLSMIEFRSKDTPVDYWIRNKAEIPELASFALFLLGAQAIATIPDHTSYHSSVISLNVKQHVKDNENLAHEMTLPDEFNDSQHVGKVENHDRIQDDILQGDSFQFLLARMKSVIDGRENDVKIAPREVGDNAEDEPEMSNNVLAPLTMEIGVAEETNAYLNAKCYCRNDKYPLCRLRCDQFQLPSALTIDDSPD